MVNTPIDIRHRTCENQVGVIVHVDHLKPEVIELIDIVTIS